MGNIKAVLVGKYNNLTEANAKLLNLKHGVVVFRGRKWVVAKTKSGGRVVYD